MLSNISNLLASQLDFIQIIPCVLFTKVGISRKQNLFLKFKSKTNKQKKTKTHKIHNLSVNYSFNVSHTVVYGN